MRTNHEAHKVGGAQRTVVAVEAYVVAESTNEVVVKSSVHELNSLCAAVLASVGERDELADHGIVIHGDLAALEHAAVHTDTLGVRRGVGINL